MCISLVFTGWQKFKYFNDLPSLILNKRIKCLTLDIFLGLELSACWISEHKAVKLNHGFLKVLVMSVKYSGIKQCKLSY